MPNEELDLQQSHTYFLELVALTFCKEDFEYEDHSSRALPELAAIAVLGSNHPYLQSLQTMEQVLVGSEEPSTISPSSLKTDYAEAKALVMDIEVLSFTYHEIHKLIRILFLKKVDKSYLRKTLETLVEWEWLSKTFDGRYSLPMHHMTNSATLKRLTFDEGVPSYEDIDAQYDASFSEESYLDGVLNENQQVS